MSSHPQRFIFTWHGNLPPKLKAVIDRIATWDETNNRWFYDGSLDRFDAAWAPSLFCVIGGDIFVTQHNSWGSR